MDFKNSFLFPVIQSIHLTGIGFLVGTIVLADLEVLGLLPFTVGDVPEWWDRNEPYGLVRRAECLGTS